MEAAATNTAYTPVGFGGAFVRQFKLLWSSRRPVLLGVALLALLVLSGDPWLTNPKPRLLTLWPLWLILIGPVWALTIFHNEGPSERMYHWSLPAGRTTHTLARVAAGWAWLWILFGVLVGAGALVAAMDGELWQLGVISAAGWINFFTGPLLGYLAVSVLAVASDYPLRWLLGILFLVPLTLSVLVEWLGLDALVETIIQPLSSMDWGLMPVMVGGLGAAVNELEHMLLAMADPTAIARGGPDVTYWWAATPLWIAILAGLVALAASRHPDTLPRLRRYR